MSGAPPAAEWTPMRLPSLSVFLPCHNEALNLRRVVDNFRAELPKVADRYEIIVVDDGSHDQTGQIADQLAAADARLRVVHHQVNRGYGGAVTSGLTAARMEWVLLCDGDGQFDAAQIARLVARTPEADVVVGRRIRRADPFMRQVNGKAWTMLVGLLFGLRLGDIDCGFKLFRRKFIEQLDLRSQGAMISTELMVRVSARRARIVEVEVEHLPRLAGEQSGASIKVIARAFGELFRLYRRLRQTPPRQP